MDEKEIDQVETQEIDDAIEPQVDQSEVPQTEEVVEEIQPLDIPEGLEEGLTQFISGIEDVNARNAHIEKFKNFNDGYLRKLNEVAEERKTFEAEREQKQTFYGGYEQLESALGDYKGGIVGHYGSPQNYFRWLHEQDIAISKNPVGYALRLLESNGVSKDNIGEAFSSDGYKTYQQSTDMDKFKNEIMQSTQQMMLQQQQQQQLNSFINASDAEGQLKHPHFAKVENIMAALVDTNPNATLEDLYTQACRAHPEVSQEFIQTQVSQEAKNIVQQKDVAKAKSVVGVKQSVDSVGKNETKSWEKELTDLIG